MKAKRSAPTETVLFSAALVLFVLSLAKSLNVYDLFTYAGNLKNSFATGDLLYPLFHSFGPYGGGVVDSALSRSSAYVVVSQAFVWLFHAKLGLDIEFSLNVLSALLVAASSVFVYKTARVFLDSGKSLAVWTLYVLMPYVFFNAINASPWSLQLFLSSVWIYLLISAVKRRDDKIGLLATAVFLVNIFSYLSSLTLVFAHFYGLYRIRKKLSWLTLNAAVLSPAAGLVYYFTAINPVYPFGFDLLRYAFMLLLLAWESVNALSVGLFVTVAFAFFKILKKLHSGKLDDLETLFLLSFIPTFSGLAVFVYNPIFIFNGLFVFIPLLAVAAIKKSGGFFAIMIVIVALVIVKSVPVYTNFHMNEHPHKPFAFWLAENVENDSVLVVGHECPAVKYYTTLNVVCRGELALPDSGKIYVTSQYFKNENQLELEFMNSYAASFLGFEPFGRIEDFIQRNDILGGKTFELVASYDPETRSMEDSYEFLFSFYPDPLRNAFFNTGFPKVKYELFRTGQ